MPFTMTAIRLAQADEGASVGEGSSGAAAPGPRHLSLVTGHWSLIILSSGGGADSWAPGVATETPAPVGEMTNDK